MYKQVAIFVAVALVVLLLATHVTQAIQMLLSFEYTVSGFLGNIFTGGQIGHWLRELLSTITPPFIITGVIAFAYWLVRKRFMPAFMPVVWAIWLVEMTALLVS